MNAALTGCSPTPAGGAPAETPKLSLLVGLDVSGSTADDETRATYHRVLEDVVDTALPPSGNTPISVWFYDTQARLEFGPQKVAAGNDLLPVGEKYLEYRSEVKDNRQACMIEKLSEAAKTGAAGAEEVACLLLTDAEDHDLAATTKAAAALAKLPNVKAVWVCGAETQAGTRNFLREKLTEALKPLGEKLVVSGRDADISGGLQRFRNLIRGGK
jgi:hypothetical protein